MRKVTGIRNGIGISELPLKHLIFGSDKSPRSHNVCSSVRS